MGPEMGDHSSHSSSAWHKNLPFDGLFDVELQVILLYSQKHEGNHAATECIGGRFNESSAGFSMLLHVCVMGC